MNKPLTAAELAAAHQMLSGAPGAVGVPSMFNPITGEINVNARRPFLDRDGNSYVLGVNSDGKVGKIRINATALLRYDEWKDIDRTVIVSAAERLIAVGDLRARGLTHNLGSIGHTISMWETMGDMTEADISMSAITRGEKDVPEFGTAQVPVPIVHKDFSYELRRLAASRAMGGSIDSTTAAIAGRVVAERTEKMLFRGAPVKVDGATIYGYLTHPDRNTVDLTENWDAVGKTGAEIIGDVQQMLAAARLDRYFGPYMIYVPAGYQGKLGDDYRDSDDRTIRDRILALDNQILDIKIADFLPANNVILVNMTRDVVDLAIAQDITTVQWSVMGGMLEEFKVMAVWVPRIKSTQEGRSGIVHLRPA